MSENVSDPRHPAVATDAEVAALDSLVTMYVEAAKGIAAFEAMKVEVLAGLSALADQQRERLPEKRAVRELPLREIAAEVALAVRASDRVMQGMITDAAQTVTLFPAAVTALSEGRISRGHLTALVDAGARIDEDDARAVFEGEALGVAERESVGRFRSIVGAMGERINPRSLADRHLLAREDRGVRIRDLADGMSEIRSVQPSVIAYGIHDRLTEQAKLVQNNARAEAAAAKSAAAKSVAARSVGASPAGGRKPVAETVEASGTAGPSTTASAQSAGSDPTSGGSVAEPLEAPEPAPDHVFVPDERSLDQVRADLFADLLLAGTPATDPTGTGDAPGLLGAIRAMVQITVPVLTAAGVDGDVAAELNGRTPVDPDTARTLVGSVSGWDRVLTHPITGAILAVDRYTPKADLKRWKTATDTRCRQPGCRMPAHRCDLDHNHPASEGGATEACNLCHFCRRHHVLKHRPGWKVRQLPGGRIEWTTPTGRVYIDEPPPRTAYLPDPPPRPGANDVPVADRGRTVTGTASDLLRRYRRSNPAGTTATDGAKTSGVTGAPGATIATGQTRASLKVSFVPDGDTPPF
jgi:hypothetical protein